MMKARAFYIAFFKRPTFATGYLKVFYIFYTKNIIMYKKINYTNKKTVIFPD